MNTLLLFRNFSLSELIVIAIVLFFLFLIVLFVNAATDGRNGKVLRRSRDRVFCGVCGGIAEYLGVSSLLIRLIFLFSGIGILTYLIIALLMRD